MGTYLQMAKIKLDPLFARLYYNDFVCLKVNEKRQVVYSYCTCPAGNSETCKHVFALYTWINIERSSGVKTDNAAQWPTHSEHLQRAYPKVEYWLT